MAKKVTPIVTLDGNSEDHPEYVVPPQAGEESGQEEETAEETRPNWPDSTEHRSLRCDLSVQEAAVYGKEQSELIQEVERLEDQKKASASHYKSLVEEKSARARRLAGYITSGWQEKTVPCHWVFEAAGCDGSDGSVIYHPEKKTLVRDDTGEVVEIREITNEERQMALPIDDASQEQI